MPIVLVTSITSTSLLALAAIAIWRPSRVIAGSGQVILLLILLVIIVVASDSMARLALAIGSSALMILYRKQGRLTSAAALLAGAVSLFVILQYPPTWTLAIAFLLGWANFVGSLSGGTDVPNASAARDMTDLAPAAMIIFLGAAVIDTNPNAAGVIVFSALAFITNDVLASDLGPELPGRAHLLPRLVAVPHGTPGAMSYAGTLAGSFGSLSAGICAGALLHSTSLGASAFIAGSAGAALDTALSRSGVRIAIGRGRELINVAGCATAVSLGLLMSWTT